MILRCRVHRAHNRVNWLPLSLLFAVSLLAPPAERAGAEPVVELLTESTTGSTPEESGVSRQSSIPLHVSIGTDMGYDDNIGTHASGEGAWFTTGNVILSYDRPGDRTELHFLTAAGLTHFFDATGTQDVNASITLALKHSTSTRLSFAANVYANYQAEPDFKTNVGPENVRANHFETTNAFSVTYHWLPRFTTVANYTFRRIKYDDLSIGMFEDRVENTFGEVFQFSRSRRTNLFGEYRFQIINYDTAPRNSTTHFALGGIDYKLTEHLTLNARGGETFRSNEHGKDTVDPYFEGSLDYAKAGRSSLKWTTSYGVEEPNSTAGALVNTTFRTGMQLTYSLSARISSVAVVYYNHAVNEGPTLAQNGSGVSQDSFDLSLSLRYAINQRFALHIDYKRTSVMSTGSTLGPTADYSRNRYSAGLNFTY